MTSAAADEAIQANIVAVGYRVLPALHCAEVGESTCYRDDERARIMGGVVMTSSSMTREQCMLSCFGLEKSLAGLEDGGQCMCGDSVTEAVPSTNCTVACPGNSSQLCGGWMAINVMNFTCAIKS